jgi:hypothetical protein
LPNPFTHACRAQYLPQFDAMWLAGYTADAPDPGGVWGRVGTTICRYDNWSGQRKLALHILIPAGHDVAPVGIALAGDYLFVQYLRRMECRVYDARNGAYVGLIEPKSPLPDDQHDTLPEFRDHIRAVTGSSGEYLIFVADPRFGKTIMYRWKATP